MHQLERLASGQRISGENLVPEGKLPNDRPFQALKKIPLRAYLWRQNNTWYVSHFRYKDKGKLNKADSARVRKNWHLVNPTGQKK